ncbi:hypothetical protein GD604_07325 [Desulfolutivibrio sulfoxidireducens]|nr:hypothetical protein GD604_07325 [Desulfolutivibrio sulfoxidireducens]
MMGPGQHDPKQAGTAMFDRNATQAAIIAALRDQARARPDEPVRRAVAGRILVAVAGSRVGLCANVAGSVFDPPAGASLRGLLGGLDLIGLDHGPACLAVAAASALLPPPDVSVRKAQDLVWAHGAGKHVAVVGHFPFVEKMGADFASFSVLELSPRPGDLPACEAARVLPSARVVAVTASALANGTLGGLLEMCAPDAFVLLVGPSAPFASCLFDFGIDVIAGSLVRDAGAVLDGVAAGLHWRALSGVTAVCVARDDHVKKIR